jgi:MFS family permease
MSEAPTTPMTAVRRLAVARAISVLGSLAAYAALVDLMFRLTDGSSFYLSATILLTIGAVGLLEPLGGWVADRFDRRLTLIWSDLAGALAFLAMAYVDDPGPLLVVAFLSAVVETPFRAGSVAAVPALVGDESLLAKANGWIGMGTNLGITVGPALGGALAAAIGAEPVFVLNAVSFVVSATLVWSIRAPFNAEDDDDEPMDVTAGFRFLLRDRVLFVVTASWMVLLLGTGLGIVADRPVAEAFDAGSVGFGLMIGLWGAGSVVGSWFASRLRAEQEPTGLVAGFWLAGIAGIGIWLSPVFGLVLACNVVWGFGDALTVVAEQGIIQRRTPDAIRARVVAANEGLVHVALIAGFLLATPAMNAIGPQATYAVGGVAALVAGACSLYVAGLARASLGPPA